VAQGKRSAGLLMFRRRSQGIEVFLVHPGGPYFVHKDAGYWGVPKGELEPDEQPLEVARREFAEETGQPVEACAREPRFTPLGVVHQRSGKQVHAWAFEGDWPAEAELRSNTFLLEWPPRSGQRQPFPEVDQGRFFNIDEARARINAPQEPLLDRLLEWLSRER